MSALWFIGFSLIWTALLTGGAHVLTRDPVPAQFAHNLWRGAAALTLLPWLLMAVYVLLPSIFATPIPDMPYIGGAVEALSNTGAVKAAAQSSASPLLAMALWAFLIIGWIARCACNALAQIRLQEIKRAATPSSQLSAEAWAKRLNLSKAPSIALIKTGSPFLAGIKRRVIYLPEAVADPMNANIICAHECTHLARGDLITRPIERFVADLFWFSPFAWIMRRQLDYWREAACDEHTVSLTGDSVAYARTLATTARLTRPAPRIDLPVAAFILPRNETLKKRLTQLLESDAKKPRRRMATIALIVGLVLAPMSLAQSLSLADKDVFSHPLIINQSAAISASYGKVLKQDTEVWHSGVDIWAPKYTLVYAPAHAKVLMAKYKEDYGNTVDIILEDGRKMRFSQLSYIKVDKGQWLQPGDLIGKVGASGKDSKTSHLHFEVYKNGEHVDPETVKGLTLIKG